MAVDWNKIQEKWQKKWKDAELGKAKVENNKEKFMMILLIQEFQDIYTLGT